MTLIFVLQNGKAILKKVKQEVNIQRAQVYNLGKMTLDPTKAKEFILKNQGLIEAVAAKVSGLTKTADGHLDIYAADNLEKILSYKGILSIANNDKLTSLDELQYYRNVTGLNLSGNKNLAGNIDLSKYPQLTEIVVIEKSPLVTEINVKGLDQIKELSANYMDGLKKLSLEGNSKLEKLSSHHNKAIENIDASNLPSLTLLETYYSGNIKSINVTDSPNLQHVNSISNGSLTSFSGLSDMTELVSFKASGSKIESYDFSNMSKLKEINLASAKVKEIKGLSAAGANLQSLQLSNTHVASLDISNNPNLTSIDLYNVKELTALDVTHNPNLTSLRVPMTSISTLDVSNNTKLTYLGVAHCKLTTLDIRNIPGLTTFYAGSQSNSAGFSQMITVTMTQAQKTKFGNIFFENASGPNNNYEGSNNYVKINVQ